MTIRSMTVAGLVAGVLGILAAACSAAPQDGTEATASGSEAVTSTCIPKFCMTGHHWDQGICECVPNCIDTVMCKVGSHWDPETCVCAANCIDNVECKAGWHWDSSVCHCVQ